ncbi:uncharacterized protein KZ484_010229 [Pholidichthys leucotaenia]
MCIQKANMSETSRALPSWMSKKAKNVEKEPARTRKRKAAARSTFYCMNEKELVEVAVSNLTSGARGGVTALTHQKVEQQMVDNTKKREKSATSPKAAKSLTLEEFSLDSPDDMEITCISETDLDITKAETVPYTRSAPGSEGQRSRPAQDHDGQTNVEMRPKEKEEQPQESVDAVKEDDALRLFLRSFLQSNGL